MSMVDFKGKSGGKPGGSQRVPIVRPQIVAKPNIDGLFWVSQRYYGLWQNGGGGFTGLATHSLAPCVGLVATAPGFAFLTHLDSDFRDRPDLREAAMHNIFTCLGLVADKSLINIHIYADAGAGGDASSQFTGRFLYTLLRGHLNPLRITLTDKLGFSGLMIVYFNNLAVVTRRDWFGLPALDNPAGNAGGVRHTAVYE